MGFGQGWSIARSFGNHVSKTSYALDTVQSSEDLKQIRPWPLKTYNLIAHLLLISTRGFVLDMSRLLPYDGHHGHTDCVLHREYDISGSPLSCALHSPTWWPCWLTYSSPKIPSPATLPSSSFQVHLWSEFSPSSHALLTKIPKALLFPQVSFGLVFLQWNLKIKRDLPGPFLIQYSLILLFYPCVVI